MSRSSFLPEGTEPNVQPEVARMFRQIGLQFMRASVVEIASLKFHPAWSISDNGEIGDSPAERSTDSMFPGAAAIVSGLVGAAPEHTRVQRLSPRRWAFTWRVSATEAILAEAHYRDKRDAISDIDTALVRLVCSTSARHSAAVTDVPVGLAEWPRVDRRAPARPSRVAWLSAALSVLSAVAALLCGWLLLSALPGAQLAAANQQAQIEQLHKTADGTMAAALATVLATGDYGLAQEELWQFEQLGHFQSAVVVNTNGRVVAMAGPLQSLRIGDAVPAAYAAQARARKLSLGSQNHGELVFMAAPAATPASLGGAKVVAGLAMLACAAAAALLALRMRQ